MNKPRILIIDDEEGLRDMLVFGLSDRGFDVATARNGEEGVALIKEMPADVVLCDIMMPGMSGIDVLTRIKQLRPETMVVMVTGYATLDTAVSAMKRGAFDYVSKPYGLDQVLVLIQRALAARKSAEREPALAGSLEVIVEGVVRLLEGSRGSLNEMQKNDLQEILRMASSALRASGVTSRPVGEAPLTPVERSQP
jgi:two-component system, OmpR family, phosphate regulon sensor histidine kinase PhoR